MLLIIIKVDKFLHSKKLYIKNCSSNSKLLKLASNGILNRNLFKKKDKEVSWSMKYLKLRWKLQ